jgi:nucleoside-diphosphate-sugar epimerase
MRIFIAGATGVVGRRVVPALIGAGHEVTAVGRTAEKRGALARAGARPVELDLFDAGAVARAVAGHEVVINLATHIPSSARILLPGAWRENSRVRRVAAANLAAGALAGGARRFIQESFALAYPGAGDAWVDETAAIAPARYNRAVLDAEAAAGRFTGRGGVGVVLRFAGFYGPDSPQLADLVRYVRKGFAPMPGRAEAFFPSVSHDDAAGAVVAALGVPAGVYNVGDDEPIRHREYFDVLARALGVPAPRLMPRWMTPLFGSLGRTLARSVRLSNRKFREASGWSPRYRSVREGLPAVVAGAGWADGALSSRTQVSGRST